MTTIRPTELKVRCYAEREAPRLWVAICLDFDLAAQGETFEDVKRKLDAVIDDYVREAWDGEDQAYADALLNRRAPLRYWLRFWWFGFWRHIRRHDDTHRPFNGRLPCRSLNERPLPAADLHRGQADPAHTRFRAPQGRERLTRAVGQG